MKRIGTALVLIPVVVWLALWAPEGALIAAFAIVGTLAFLEYWRIVSTLPAAIAQRVLGLIYVFAPLVCGVALHRINPHWLMFALLLSWAGDTAALYVGRSIGRHPLAPRVSPKKTWEGSIGSVAGSIVAGALYAHYLLPQAPISEVLLLAFCGNIAGQLGDLAESALKRRAGVKDSGSSLPGHGGWLDRIDAMLFALPVVYFIVVLYPR
jgi:phosphatidate cytidylyltransferase